MKTIGIGITACVMSAGIAASANAAIISGSLNVSASGYGIGAPVDPVTAVITYSFDNSADVPETTSGLSVTGLNIAGTLGPGMLYTASNDILVVGDRVGGVNFGVAGTNDWILAITNISTNPTFRNLAYYTQQAGPFNTRDGSVTPFVVSAAEPESLALLATGIIAAAGVSRFRRRKGPVQPRASLRVAE